MPRRGGVGEREVIVQFKGILHGASRPKTAQAQVVEAFRSRATASAIVPECCRSKRRHSHKRAQPSRSWDAVPGSQGTWS